MSKAAEGTTTSRRALLAGAAVAGLVSAIPAMAARSEPDFPALVRRLKELAKAREPHWEVICATDDQWYATMESMLARLNEEAAAKGLPRAVVAKMKTDAMFDYSRRIGREQAIEAHTELFDESDRIHQVILSAPITSWQALSAQCFVISEKMEWTDEEGDYYQDEVRKTLKRLMEVADGRALS